MNLTISELLHHFSMAVDAISSDDIQSDHYSHQQDAYDAGLSHAESAIFDKVHELHEAGLL